VEYNGAEITGKTNTISANGLTFTLKKVTAGMDTPGDTTDDEVINLSVEDNTQAVYDMVKDFVTKYNELVKEMNEVFYAPSAKGFDPLTDEEKETMTDDQIEKWETKIKDSLLRRDDTLGSILSTMRSSLTASVEVDGKDYTLSSFGIGSANYTEKGILHITGDKDDSLLSASENKLMKALTEDPDTVMQVFNKLAGDLYGTLNEKMSSTSLRSALTLYNDKEMTKSVTNYKEDLKELEDKLKTIEDRYYKQFAAMETAMAKMNSQSSSLASMLGLNTQ
jgi:flagellar hook-associated protein 2